MFGPFLGVSRCLKTFFLRKGPAPTPTCCAVSGWYPSIHSSNAQGPESPTCQGTKNPKRPQICWRWLILEVYERLVFNAFMNFSKPNPSKTWHRFHTTASSDSSLGVVQKASSDNTIHVRQTDNLVPTCTNIFWKQKLEQSMQNTRGPSAVSASFSYVPWSKDRLDMSRLYVVYSHPFNVGTPYDGYINPNWWIVWVSHQTTR